MKHLNPELERLEQRIAPSLLASVGAQVDVYVGCGGGTSATDYDCCPSSGGSCSDNSNSGCSATGSSESC
jgi:hypothetical protein